MAQIQEQGKTPETESNSPDTQKDDLKDTFKIGSIAINIMILAILLLITELCMDASTLHNTLLIIIAVIIALLPIATFFLKDTKMNKSICLASLIGTIILSALLFYLKTNVYKYIITNPDITDFQAKKILELASSRGIVVIMAKDMSVIDKYKGEGHEELKKLLLSEEQMEDLELNIESLEEIDSYSKWSRIEQKGVILINSGYFKDVETGLASFEKLPQTE